VSQQFKETVQAGLEHMWTKLLDDGERRDVVFVWFDGIMGSVSGFMSLVNLFTQKWLLMGLTLIFFLACMINIWLSRHGREKLAQTFFLVEVLVLCGFFCISGIPEGFSALWTCFIPSFTLTMMGIRRGSYYSAYGFLMIIGIFWTPWGRSLLQYGYTDSFMLRFPMIYLAFYVMSLCLEAIRAETQKRMAEAERRYQYLYVHDALTGIYNRYGFNERLNQVFSDPQVEELGLLILDLDMFKKVNDTYGHDAGDIVLKFVADTLQRMSGENAAVCRWGGEEFTILLWNEKDPVRLAEQIRREIEASEINYGDSTIRVTVSVGVCTVGDRSDVTIAMLVKGADRCLYQAKDLGRNLVCDARL
jgi:diguanylate cyclase (GGDEF)-like protein